MGSDAGPIGMASSVACWISPGGVSPGSRRLANKSEALGWPGPVGKSQGFGWDGPVQDLLIFRVWEAGLA